MTSGRYVNLKIIESGDRLEVYKYSRAYEIGLPSNNDTGRKGKGKKEPDKEKNRRETLIKARNNIVRLVNCNPDLLTFITFTYKENMQDITQSKADLKKCIKKLKKDFESFKYLYVMEFQHRGAIHYHMICNLHVPVKTAKTKERKSEEQKLFERQFSNAYWKHGFVDIRCLEGNTNVGLYIAVYLVEDLFNIDLKGARCYAYSQNLNKPKERAILTDMKPYEIAQTFAEYKLKYSSSYEMKYEIDKEQITNRVNYFDFYREVTSIE